MGKKRSLKRINRPGRVRGTPLFDTPMIRPEENKVDLVKPPETSMDIARFLSDEVRLKWPDVETPVTLSGKHTKLTKTMLEEFSPENVREMVRILVWDFEEIKKDKGFFPPSNHLVYPWIDQLYNYRHALVGAIKKGITNSSSRTSAYVQRYHSDTPPTLTPAQPVTSEESMKDVAKRLLGQ